MDKREFKEQKSHITQFQQTGHLYDLPVFQKGTLSRKITRLETSLTAFSQITGIPVSFFSSAGKYQWSTLPGNRVCDTNRQYGDEELSCTRNLISSMNIALSLPDVYIFMCNAGLINLCYALIIEKEVCGFLMAGPVAMGSSIEKITSSFSAKTVSQSINYSRLIPLMGNMKLYSPQEITSLSTLFYNSAAASLELETESPNNLRYQHHHEQSEIGRRLINMKKEQLSVEYPYDSETNLINVIKSGNAELCRKQFSKYVEDIMIFEGGNLAIVKLRLISLITQLLKSEEDWQKDYENLFLLEKINEAQTFKEIMQTGNSLLASLAESVTARAYCGSSVIIKKAIAYLNEHYSDNISLKSLASAIHVNSSYLSTLFKQETGIPFALYLSEIRLARAEKLLSSTSMSITEISLNTGFSSASYFTKLFKEKNGITPKEFRRRSQ